MVMYKGVRSTAATVNEIEKDENFIYARSNIQKIDEKDTEMSPGFHGWQYDETVYTKDEYIDRVNKQLTDTQLALVEVYELIGG